MKTHKYFIDCGFYVGKALEYYAPFLDNSWEVIVFEPNETLEVEESIKRFPFTVQWFKQAVWTHDGETDFVIGGRHDASYLAELHGDVPEIATTVSCIDFSRFIKELPKDSTVVVSMDVEGAEFPILEKMLQDGTAQKINLLDIEFHHRIIESKGEPDASRLRIALEGEGVLVKLKLEL